MGSGGKGGVRVSVQDGNRERGVREGGVETTTHPLLHLLLHERTEEIVECVEGAVCVDVVDALGS